MDLRGMGIALSDILCLLCQSGVHIFVKTFTGNKEKSLDKKEITLILRSMYYKV